MNIYTEYQRLNELYNSFEVDLTITSNGFTIYDDITGHEYTCSSESEAIDIITMLAKLSEY